MIAIVHSIYSQSVHAPALNAGLMDNDDERYCRCYMKVSVIEQCFILTQISTVFARSHCNTNINKILNCLTSLIKCVEM